MHMPVVFPDSLEVLVFQTEAGPTLVAAIELVSPSNKDRQEQRRAFAAKCSSYVQQGIGLMIIDIVTNRQANLHNALVHLLQAGEQFLLPEEPLYATAYRPVRRADTDEVDVWHAALAVQPTFLYAVTVRGRKRLRGKPLLDTYFNPMQLGEPLPNLAIWLDVDLSLPVDLEASYEETCRVLRIR